MFKVRSPHPDLVFRRYSWPNGNNFTTFGLDFRTRDDDGEIRQKRGDTLVRTLRQIYGPDFAPGVRSDMRLDTLRERVGGGVALADTEGRASTGR